MNDLRELAYRLEAEAIRKAQGWDGAFPCKPDSEIISAVSFFAAADALRKCARNGPNILHTEAGDIEVYGNVVIKQVESISD